MARQPGGRPARAHQCVDSRRPRGACRDRASRRGRLRLRSTEPRRDTFSRRPRPGGCSRRPVCRRHCAREPRLRDFAVARSPRSARQATRARSRRRKRSLASSGPRSSGAAMRGPTSRGRLEAGDVHGRVTISASAQYLIETPTAPCSWSREARRQFRRRVMETMDRGAAGGPPLRPGRRGRTRPSGAS